MEPDSESIVYDNFIRFSERTLIRMMIKITGSIAASGLPTTVENKYFKSSFNNSGLDQQERTAESMK